MFHYTQKKRFFLLVFAMSLFMAGCADTGSVKRTAGVPDISEDKAVLSMGERPLLPVGKRFVFLVAWNNIPVGRILAEVEGPMGYGGRDAYVVRLKTESNKFLSKIYRVEDTYTSFVDTGRMTSLRYEADRKEGNYRKHVIVEYDEEAREAVYTNLTDGSVKKCGIKEEVHDPLSAMCYFMTMPLGPGDEVRITVNLNEKNYDISGRVGTIEVVKLPDMGMFPAFSVRPYVELGGEEVRKGRAWMYFSADSDRLPLYGVVLIPFGRVTATLRSVEESSGS